MLNINSIFNRLGQIGAQIGTINAFRGTTIPAATDTLALTYVMDDDQPLVDNIYNNLTAYQNSPSQWLNALQQLATQTIIADVTAEYPLLQPTIGNALRALIADMVTQGQSVAPNTVGAIAVPNPNNVGNAAMVVSKYLATGNVAQNAFNETLRAVCTADGTYQGGGIAGQETITITGEPTTQSTLSWLYPGGSGASLTIRAVNASLNNQGGNGNWLNNGDFANWSNNVPSNWRVATGTPGTTIVQGTNTFDGTPVLNFVGNGTEQTAVYQIFGQDNRLPLSPTSLLSFNLWMSMSSTPSTGVLEVALVDANGNVILDTIGNPNLFTKSLTGGIAPWGAVPWGEGGWGLNQGYGAWGTFPWGDNPWGENTGSPFGAFSGTFRIPSPAPSYAAIRLRLSTPLQSGTTLSIDRIGATVPISLYSQGPSLAAFGGQYNLIKGDAYAIEAQNNLAGLFQTLFAAMFNTPSLGLIVPTATFPSQPNTLMSIGNGMIPLNGGSLVSPMSIPHE